MCKIELDLSNDKSIASTYCLSTKRGFELEQNPTQKGYLTRMMSMEINGN